MTARLANITVAISAGPVIRFSREWHYLSPCCLAEVTPIRLGVFRCDGCGAAHDDDTLVRSDEPHLGNDPVWQAALNGGAEAMRRFGVTAPASATDETVQRLHELGKAVRRRAGC